LRLTKNWLNNAGARRAFIVGESMLYVFADFARMDIAQYNNLFEH
jgi:hypothetical protein